MRAAGYEAASRSARPTRGAAICASRATRVRLGAPADGDDHPSSRSAISSEPQRDVRRRCSDSPVNEREIVLLSCRAGHRPLQGRVDGGRLGDEDDAGRQFVQAADD